MSTQFFLSFEMHIFLNFQCWKNKNQQYLFFACFSAKKTEILKMLNGYTEGLRVSIKVVTCSCGLSLQLPQTHLQKIQREIVWLLLHQGHLPPYGPASPLPPLSPESWVLVSPSWRCSTSCTLLALITSPAGSIAWPEPSSASTQLTVVPLFGWSLLWYTVSASSKWVPLWVQTASFEHYS